MIISVCPSCSGTVSIFRPLGSSVRPEGLRFELERNLLSPSQPGRILLSPAAPPSPEHLSGRQAVCHVTEQRLTWRFCFTIILCGLCSGSATSVHWTLTSSLFYTYYDNGYGATRSTTHPNQMTVVAQLDKINPQARSISPTRAWNKHYMWLFFPSLKFLKMMLISCGKKY